MNEAALSSHKIPPQNIEAEQSVLGGILIENEAVNKALEILAPEDFYRDRHGWIFLAALQMMEKGEPVNQITLAHQLAQNGKLEACGGSAYLSHLIANSPTSIFIDDYAQLVSKTAKLRALISIGRQIEEIGYTDDDPTGAFSKAISLLVDANTKKGVGLQSMRAWMDRLMERFVNYIDKPAEIPGLPFPGFPGLTKWTEGMQKQRLYVMGGLPGHGKSQFALQTVMGLADMGKRIAMFSLEMDAYSLAQRQVFRDSGVGRFEYRDGPDDRKHAKLIDATGKVAERKTLFLSEKRGLKIRDIMAMCMELAAQGPLDLIVVDYANLIAQSAGTETDRMAAITVQLAELAGHLDAPVLAVYQLSRDLNNRGPQFQPMLKDFYFSGTIDHRADVALVGMYRWKFYESMKGNWGELYKGAEPPSPTEWSLYLLKSKEGPGGKLNCYWNVPRGIMGEGAEGY